MPLASRETIIKLTQRYNSLSYIGSPIVLTDDGDTVLDNKLIDAYLRSVTPPVGDITLLAWLESINEALGLCHINHDQNFTDVVAPRPDSFTIEGRAIIFPRGTSEEIKIRLKDDSLANFLLIDRFGLIVHRKDTTFNQS